MRGFRTSADLGVCGFVCLIFGRFFAEQSSNRSHEKRAQFLARTASRYGKSVSAQMSI